MASSVVLITPANTLCNNNFPRHYASTIISKCSFSLCFHQLIKASICDGIIAPGYDAEALAILQAKKKGAFIVLQADPDYVPPEVEYRYCPNCAMCYAVIIIAQRVLYATPSWDSPCIVRFYETQHDCFYYGTLLYVFNFEHRELYGVGFSQRRNDIICGEESLKDVVVTGTGLQEGTTGE